MKDKKLSTEKERCFCIYCDVEIAEADSPFCQLCRITRFYCPNCRKPFSREYRVCPYCGTEIRV